MKDKIIQIGKDSVWYLVATVVTSVIAFISIPIFTRVFDPHDYGVYSLIATTISLLAPVAYAWMDGAIIRFYPEYEKKGEIDAFYSTVFHYVPHFLLVFFVILIPVAIFVPGLGEYRQLICLGVAIFALFSVFSILLAQMRVLHKSWQYCVSLISLSACRYLVGVGLAVWGHLGIAGIFWGWLGILILIIPVELLVVSAQKHFKWSKYSSKMMKAFIGYGFVLIIGAALQNVMVSIDRYMVQIFEGAAQVGLYSFVYNLIEGIGGIMAGFLVLAAGPVVVRTFEHEGEEETVALVSRLTRYFFIILIPSALGLWILRERIFLVVAGSEYQESVKAVLPLVAGDLLVKLTWLPSVSFMMKKKTKFILIPLAAGTVSNIALNVFLIPAMGYVGAAWATLASYAIYFGLLVALGRRYMPWRFSYADLFRVCLATAVMGGGLFLLNEIPMSGVAGLVVIILCGVAVYGVSIVAVRGITKTEVGFIIRKTRQAAGRLHRR